MSIAKMRGDAWSYYACDVATSAGPGLDGHLIEANGFVAGDADLGGGG